MIEKWEKCTPECTCKVCKQVVYRSDDSNFVKCLNENCEAFNALKDYNEIDMIPKRVKMFGISNED